MILGLLSLWLHLATHAMMQCSDTQCHLANCPELPASNPGFNSSCEQCLAEMEMERSFSPEAGDIRRDIISVSTGPDITCFKSIFWILWLTREGSRMTILISRGWRRGGWSPWAASAPWTLHRAATSVTMPRLEPETGGTDWGCVAETFYPGFFKINFKWEKIFVLFVTFWLVLCRCNCSILRATLVSSKVHTEISTQEY